MVENIGGGYKVIVFAIFFACENYESCRGA